MEQILDLLARLLAPLGRRVPAIVSFDHFTLLLDVTRTTTSSSLRAKLAGAM